MKLILLSDIHATFTKPTSRKDELFFEVVEEKLSHVWNRARQLGAKIIQAGDFCDKPRDWVVCYWLGGFLRKWGIPLFMIRGQHDMYMHSPIAPATIPVLTELGSLTILDGTIDISRLQYPNGLNTWSGKILVTGVSYGEPAGENPERTKNDVRILVIHAPIAEAPLFDRHDYVNASEFARKYNGYDFILCGDIHRAFNIKVGKTTILNTGPMLRLDAAKYSFQHQPHFYILDTDTKELTKEIIPHAPAEEVLTREHLEAVEETTLLMADFVTKVRETLNQESPGVDVQANLKRALATVEMPDSTRNLILEVVSATNG